MILELQYLHSSQHYSVTSVRIADDGTKLTWTGTDGLSDGCTLDDAVTVRLYDGATIRTLHCPERRGSIEIGGDEGKVVMRGRGEASGTVAASTTYWWTSPDSMPPMARYTVTPTPSRAVVDAFMARVEEHKDAVERSLAELRALDTQS